LLSPSVATSPRSLLKCSPKGEGVFPSHKRDIKDAFNGKRYLQPNLAYDLAVFSRKISDRELQVAYMLCEGKTISDVAKSLRLSTKTVHTHKMNARKKFKTINKTFHWKLHSQFHLNFSSSPLS